MFGNITKVFFGFAMITGLLAVGGSFYTIDEGERGVKTRYGKVIGSVEPGLGFKIPFVEDVDAFSVRTAKIGYTDITALSKDLQQITVDIIVNYQVDPAQVVHIYTTLGLNYEERVIFPAILDVTKTVFGQFTAQKSVDERTSMSEQMTLQLAEELTNYGMIIHQVQIQDVDFSKEFLASVESRMQAEIDVQKKEQNLEEQRIDADIKRVKAQGVADANLSIAIAQAEANLTLATANAEAIRLEGLAEAERIQAKGEALGQNPSLVDLIRAETWNGQLPTTVLPNSAAAFMNIGK